MREADMWCVPLALDFVECDTCRAKPGSPTLCRGCLRNRAVICALITASSPAEHARAQGLAAAILWPAR